MMKADIKIKKADIEITDGTSYDADKKSFWQLLEKKTCNECTVECKNLINQEQEKNKESYLWRWFENLCRCILCNCLLCKDRLETKSINDESKKCLLTQYLNNVVPDWREMKEDRLYKHIQRTLDNAEEIRRFEIELVWKRSVYMAGILLLTFTGFAWTLQVDTTNKVLVSEDMVELILLALAIVNIVFSFCFWMMNAESQAWQKNWECHADYLQELVGARMMRTLLRKKACIFSIGKINIFIGGFLTMLWLSVTFLILTCDNNMCPFFGYLTIEKFKWFCLLMFIIMTNILVYYLISKCKFPNVDNITTQPLKKFDFSKLDLELPPKKESNKAGAKKAGTKKAGAKKAGAKKVKKV